MTINLIYFNNNEIKMKYFRTNPFIHKIKIKIFHGSFKLKNLLGKDQDFSTTILIGFKLFLSIFSRM